MTLTSDVFRVKGATMHLFRTMCTASVRLNKLFGLIVICGLASLYHGESRYREELVSTSYTEIGVGSQVTVMIGK
jgi:hypothetical protein